MTSGDLGRDGLDIASEQDDNVESTAKPVGGCLVSRIDLVLITVEIKVIKHR